mmetsp:Transcript_23595/g.38930  ORF Transcript_23595/g.38930 Transcript_23595/m.38930 type:complete len:333 (+) Transcript_23595:691-1689(+)
MDAQTVQLVPNDKFARVSRGPLTSAIGGAVSDIARLGGGSICKTTLRSPALVMLESVSSKSVVEGWIFTAHLMLSFSSLESSEEPGGGTSVCGSTAAGIAPSIGSTTAPGIAAGASSSESKSSDTPGGGALGVTATGGAPGGAGASSRRSPKRSACGATGGDAVGAATPPSIFFFFFFSLGGGPGGIATAATDCAGSTTAGAGGACATFAALELPAMPPKSAAAIFSFSVGSLCCVWEAAGRGDETPWLTTADCDSTDGTCIDGAAGVEVGVSVLPTALKPWAPHFFATPAVFSPPELPNPPFDAHPVSVLLASEPTARAGPMPPAVVSMLR